jgi:amino acid transporter
MARDIGSAAWLLIIWLVTGLITVAAALSYGELAGMMPKAGGQFVYIQRAYGRLVSFYMAGLFYRYSDWSYCCNCSYVCKLFCDILPVLDTTFLDWAIVLFFLLVNCWLSQVLLYSRSSILKGLKAEINSINFNIG